MHGTAMESRMAPSYANMFLAKFETDALSRAPHQPHPWWRYTNDMFMIWTGFFSISFLCLDHFYYL